MKLVRPRLIKISMMVVSIVVTTLVQGNINSSSMSPHLFPGTNVSGKDEGCSHKSPKMMKKIRSPDITSSKLSLGQNVTVSCIKLGTGV